MEYLLVVTSVQWLLSGYSVVTTYTALTWNGMFLIHFKGQTTERELIGAPCITTREVQWCGSTSTVVLPVH